MAPVAQLAGRNDKNQSSGSGLSSLAEWAEKYGAREYDAYKSRESAPLSYEEWLASPMIPGLCLWQVAMDIWNEETSSVC